MDEAYCSIKPRPFWEQGSNFLGEVIGAPEEIRTPGLWLRRPTLYPLSYRRNVRIIAQCYNYAEFPIDILQKYLVLIGDFILI